MNFDDFQKAWQSQDATAKVTINADVLLCEVRRNQQSFRRSIFVRDMIEVSVAAVLVPIFIAGGLKVSWTLYLCAFSCFVVGAYFVVDRWEQKKKTPDLHGSLKACAATSLAEVNHQIWLLKNVLWWYLLPIFVPIMIFFGWVALRVHASFWAKICALLPNTMFVVLLYAGIYWLNQLAVKKNLKPRRQELEKLLNGLETENHPLTIPSKAMKTKKPFGPLVLVLLVSIIVILAHAGIKDKPATSLEAIRKQYALPALAVVVVKDGQICERDVAGVRKSGDDARVTTNDVFHIGSCTKSMTATLAAMLIEEGKLKWDTSIAEVFPELRGKMDKQYEAVTIEQLLHHRGGVPSAPPADAWVEAWKEIGTPMQQRRNFIEAVLAAVPEATPGTKMIYSNQGYAIIGAMLEKITGTNYETLLTEKLFRPLRMDSAGFGSPGTIDKTDQPWGHTKKLFMTMPVQLDNPPAITSAARVHCSLDDLARFVMLHLQCHATNGLLKPETLARLHTPSDDGDYACGWVVVKRGWAGGNALMHNGSNTFWYIVMWLAPEKNFAVIAATNIFGDEAEKGCDDAASAMIFKWLPK